MNTVNTVNTMEMEGGNFITDFFSSLWKRLGFGKRIDGFITDGKFNPNDIVRAKGVLSEQLMNDLQKLTSVNMGKKGSEAQDFVTKIIARDQSIPSEEKAKAVKAFSYFVKNQKDLTNRSTYNKLMGEYKKNIDLVAN